MPKAVDFPQLRDLNFPNQLPKDIDRSFFSLIRCTSYFPVLNQKYRSLQCKWSLACDYSWYLITANITRERLMHLVLFLLFFFTYQFDITCTLIKNPNSFDFDTIFPNWMGTGTSTNGLKKIAEQNNLWIC